MPARYLIGIDLGTTNCAVAYVDTRATDLRVRTFEMPQLVAPSEVLPRSQLPSFVYLATDIDLAQPETALPWSTSNRQEFPPGTPSGGDQVAGGARVVVGELARRQGARMASRMISSAKSWLCHSGVDRHAAILPWGESEGPKLSPVNAQAAMLSHIRHAWEHAFGEAFADQDVLVTVPASFDEAARELTLQAASAASYPPIVLLEEPQAAFYAWIANPDLVGVRSALSPGDRVLVFDVGGGTTDFTLIEVDAAGDGFSRTAVGDHLLLGGDNLDLTLAKLVEQRIVGGSAAKSDSSPSGMRNSLDSLQWHSLVHACRQAKETLLSEGGPDTAPIAIQGRGTKLVGATLRDEISRAELEPILFNGFFPLVARDAPLVRGRSGLQEFGLPYAADPAVTRHLAAFLVRHEASHIHHVLFNGGAMTPPALRRRVLEQIAQWQGSTPNELKVSAPELAVAQGAAYYGLVRRGLATRIKGGTARAYYIGVEAEGRLRREPNVGSGDDAGTDRMALCLATAGLDDGATVALEREFRLITNRPVSFRLYSSSTRTDPPGALVPVGDGRADTTDDGSDLLELPPIVTVLRARGRSEAVVRLQVHITNLGALEVSCVDPASGETWKLGFDMRSGGAAPSSSAQSDSHPPEVDRAKQMVVTAFSATSGLAPLARELETLLQARRDDWPVTTTRALFDALAEVSDSRKRSAEHEQRWLNLAGFLLRPGTGAPLDAWRSRVMWGIFHENLCFPKSEPSRLAWWITWRRISGGLGKGQQEQLFDRISALLLPNARQAKKLADAKPSRQELAEMWRTAASLERLPVEAKIKLGNEVVRRIDARKGREDSVYLWALSRIGARVPLYGPLNAIVPPAQAAQWIETALTWNLPEPDRAAFALAQLGRRTGDRSRDLVDATRAKLAGALRALPAGERAAVLVEHVVALEAREERIALGDTLPAGLRLDVVDYD